MLLPFPAGTAAWQWESWMAALPAGRRPSEQSSCLEEGRRLPRFPAPTPSSLTWGRMCYCMYRGKPWSQEWVLRERALKWKWLYLNICRGHGLELVGLGHLLKTHLALKGSTTSALGLSVDLLSSSGSPFWIISFWIIIRQMTLWPPTSNLERDFWPGLVVQRIGMILY